MELHQFKQVVTKKSCPTCGQEFLLGDEESVCPVDGAMLAPVLDDPFLGQTLADSFEIIEALGSGASGTVYRAKQTPLGRIVAVKILQNALVSDLDKVRRFEREARALSLLVHTNIVNIFDYGLLPRPYMIMEYVEGKTLEESLAESKFDFESVIDIARQICSALEVAHEQNVIHRDLKPANIMLGSNDQGERVVKLLDFGLAKLMLDNEAASPGLTRSGEVVGSPPYMSPEQCMGRTLDCRSDIYSLACIIYEMLTGERPFTANSAAEYMSKHSFETPRAFLEVNPKLLLPQMIEDVIFKALQKEPENRHQSVAELKADLEKSLNVAIKSGVGVLKKKRKVHKARILIMAGSVVLVSGAVFCWQLFPSALPEVLHKRAVEAAEKALKEKDYVYAEDQLKKAIEFANGLSPKEQEKQKFASMVQLLEVYKQQGNWAAAGLLNDKLIPMSKIEDRKRRYGGSLGRNGLGFYFPSKWFIQQGDPEWNDGGNFKVAHVLRSGQFRVQIYRDNLTAAQLADLEQQVYSKTCRNYKLVSSTMIPMRDGTTKAHVRDIEINGDFGLDDSVKSNGAQGDASFKGSSFPAAKPGAKPLDSKPETLVLKSWETGDNTLQRHVYFGKPGRIFKLRVQGDKIDFSHLTRSLETVLDSVEFYPDQPIAVKHRADLSKSKFYVQKDAPAAPLCVVPPGDKPVEGYTKAIEISVPSADTE